MFAVKCLFAIDAIAAVYRAEPPRFEHAARTKWHGLCYRYWRRLERRRPPLRPAFRSFGRRKKPPGRRPPAQRVLGFHAAVALRHFSPSEGAAAAPSLDRKGRSPAAVASGDAAAPANLRALGKIENLTRGGMSDASKSERRLGRGRSDSLADKADRFGEHRMAPRSGVRPAERQTLTIESSAIESSQCCHARRPYP